MKPKVSAQKNPFRAFLLPLAAFVVLAAISFLFAPAGETAKNFVKLFFEGNSFGKTIAFFAFEIALLAVLALASRAKWRPKQNPRLWLKVFFVCVVLLWVAGFGAQQWLFAQQGVGANGYVGAIYSEKGFTSWEATYLGHNHSNKVAVTELLSVFGLQKNQGLDTGLPLYTLFPFARELGILVLALSAILLVSGLLFALSRFGKPDRWFWLWNLAFFAGFVQAIDGGLFSIVGINFVGLCAIFLIHEFCAKKKTHKYLDNGFARLVLAPLIAMLAIALTLQLLAGTFFLENHGAMVLLIGFALFALEKSNKKVFWASIGAIAAVVLLFPWILGLANNSIALGESDIYIYPSQGRNAQEWGSAFEGMLEVRSIETYNNFAILHSSAPRPVPVEDLKDRLAMHGNGHYFDIEVAGEKSTYEFTIPLESIEKFRSLKSDSFKVVLVKEENGRGKVTVQARASQLTALLFGLNIEQAGGSMGLAALAMQKIA